MKYLVAAAAAGLAMVWSAAAFAGTDYSATVTIDGGLPALRTGSPVFDGPHSLNGDWTDLGRRDARAYARDLLGVDGGGNPVWEDWRGGPGRHNVSGPSNSIGEVIAQAPSLDRSGSGDAMVFGNSIRARGNVAGASADVTTSAVWTRGFSLGAGESFTFKTLCTLGVLGDGWPLDSVTWFSLDAATSFASLTMADAANRVRTSLTGSLTSLFEGSLADVFSYSVGPGGALWLSVMNPTASTMTGSLGAGSYVEVSAPIPEPGTWALMLVGAAILASAKLRCGSQEAGIPVRLRHSTRALLTWYAAHFSYRPDRLAQTRRASAVGP